MLKVSALLALFTIVKCGTYEPGTPGAPWTPDIAGIIRYYQTHLKFEKQNSLTNNLIIQEQAFLSMAK